jgi:hypothetical protein
MPKNRPTPRTVRAQITMRRIREKNAATPPTPAEITRARRQTAASRGYRGPLTREEHARNASHR